MDRLSRMNKVKELRESLGLTQDTLAQMIGVTKGSISAYETAKADPSPSVAIKMIAAAKTCGKNIGFDDIFSA